MKKIKFLIGIALLFLVVGVAAIATQLDFNLNASFASNTEDFDVYFSDFFVDGEQNDEVLADKRQFTFNYYLYDLGHTYTVEYEITNASRNYDADISITCSSGDDYVGYQNNFDDSTYLSARSSRTGTLTVTQIKANAGEAFESSVVCNINAVAVERNSAKDDYVKTPFTDPYEIGREIRFAGELFNIIDVDEEYVYLLSQKGLDRYGNLSDDAEGVPFSTGSGWEHIPGPNEIDLEEYAPKIYRMLNDFSMNLSMDVGFGIYDVDLITLKQLEKLGCTIESDYSYSDDVTCYDSPYRYLFDGSINFWTKSASSDNLNDVWVIEFGDLCAEPYDFTAHDVYVRPVIKVSKEQLE